MDVKTLVKKYGKKNVIFGLPMAKSTLSLLLTNKKDIETKEILCEIVETRYKVSEGYKIELAPINTNFNNETLYQSDLESIIRDGHLKVYVKTLEDVSSLFKP